VPAPVDPARARVAGVRFYHDAAAAFAVMSHKVNFLSLFDFFRSFRGDEIDDA
jgi:hypothetical protein